MLRKYSSPAIDPAPSVPSSIACARARSRPGLTRAVTRYLIGFRLQASVAVLVWVVDLRLCCGPSALGFRPSALGRGPSAFGFRPWALVPSRDQRPTTNDCNQQLRPTTNDYNQRLTTVTNDSQLMTN